MPNLTGGKSITSRTTTIIIATQRSNSRFAIRSPSPGVFTFIVPSFIYPWVYSVAFGLAGAAAGWLGDTAFDTHYLLTLVFPVTMEHYWFMTAYIFLYLLLPFVGVAVRKMTKQQPFQMDVIKNSKQSHRRCKGQHMIIFQAHFQHSLQAARVQVHLAQRHGSPKDKQTAAHVQRQTAPSLLQKPRSKTAQVCRRHKHFVFGVLSVEEYPASPAGDRCPGI